MDKNVKNWEVGSTWYTKPKDMVTSLSKVSNPVPGDISFVSTCRSAIKECIKEIPDAKTAIVPAFTCHSVIEPFIKTGIEVRTYQVKQDLSIDWNNLFNVVNKQSPDIVLIHGYFGFAYDEKDLQYVRQLKEQGVVVIEDRTQNMFSDLECIPSQYQVGSIRKWFPVPDGAFLRGKDINCLYEDEELSRAKSEALSLKGEYIYNGKGYKNNFMTKFADAEKLLDSREQTYGMSELTREYLRNTDFSHLKGTRRKNYKCLSERISKHHELQMIHPNLSDGEVPFLLPVYVADFRADFQKYMAQHCVYPTIIWKCPEEIDGDISESSKYVYDNILCFHVDQRYDETDMNRVGDIIDSYFKNTRYGK